MILPNFLKYPVQKDENQVCAVFFTLLQVWSITRTHLSPEPVHLLINDSEKLTQFVKAVVLFTVLRDLFFLANLTVGTKLQGIECFLIFKERQSCIAVSSVIYTRDYES